ncbi:MAG: hypothetical protein IJV89_09765 [Lentisphaeria bacterium]|nr:hypothetical protein [Lentisphaeria bacterium]
MKKWMTLLVTAMIGSAAVSAEYFIAPDGKDSNPGTKKAPWKTMEFASAKLLPGDTLTFLPGRYSGNLIPPRSGAKNAPITYRASEAGKAVLTGGPRSEYAALVKDVQHVILDGFRYDVKPGTRWMRVENVSHAIFRNLHMEHSTIYDPIRCQNMHYCRFENVKAFRCNYDGRDGLVSSDMWNNYNISHNVFDGLYISRVGHRPFGLWFDCRKNVVRNSVFDGRWCRNFEFFSPKGVLMERCVITNAFEGSGSFDGRAKLFTIDGIFRYNLIMRNGFCPLVINAYRYQDMPPFGMKRSRLYFNTWYMNQDCGWQMVDMGKKDGTFMVENNVVKNNIMVDNNPADGTALQIHSNIAPDNMFLNNLLRGRKAGDTTVKIPSWPGPARMFTAEEANAAMPKQYAGNFDADPGFVNADADDYRLRPDSPAREKAANLTETVESQAKSIYLSVKDSRYFYDGYGIPGEKGDLIYVGPDKTEARVILNDTEQNVLTLDRPISFKKGDSVNLAYAGKAPDLGAYQTGLQTGPVFDPKAVRQEKMDTAVTPVVTCNFEPEDQENWFYLWKWTRRINSRAFVDKTGGANNSKGCFKVVAEKNAYGKKYAGSVLSTHICPARWFIDRFPYVKFSYRIPKGTPVGISLHETSKTAASSIPAEVALGGTGNFDPRNVYGSTLINLNKIKLIDDGQWHTLTLDVRAIREKFPHVKMLSRLQFWTPGANGKIGDCYWIDDFSILPEK